MHFTSLQNERRFLIDFVDNFSEGLPEFLRQPAPPIFDDVLPVFETPPPKLKILDLLFGDHLRQGHLLLHMFDPFLNILDLVRAMLSLCDTPKAEQTVPTCEANK